MATGKQRGANTWRQQTGPREIGKEHCASTWRQALESMGARRYERKVFESMGARRYGRKVFESMDARFLRVWAQGVGVYGRKALEGNYGRKALENVRCRDYGRLRLWALEEKYGRKI